MKKINFVPLFLFVLIVSLFFREFIFFGKIPVPADTIVGLYHPFRDLYAQNYPNGIPFKNFLITDPVRQQYPWRESAISIGRNMQLPLWNPYSFGGTPLIANLQSAFFNPFNILFFIFPTFFAWSILILLGQMMGGVFLYFYLNNLKLNKFASFLGVLSFSFSGFVISWFEWGTIIYSALWLPLILLSIDKIIFNYHISINSGLQVKNKNLLIWIIIFIFSITSSFFAGHLQTFFYVVILSIVYFLARWIQFGKAKKALLLFLILYLIFIIISSIQWIPLFQFINLSARDLDQINWLKEGWFIPWQNLIQFFAPDFFGNPTTLNYWGVWNYAEFIGYIGILPLLMAFFALFFRHDKKTIFYGAIFFISLIFSLPTIFAKIPFILNVPFISTAQPTRLIFLTDFSLCMLAALGFDYFLNKKKKTIYPIIFMTIVFIGLWLFILAKGFNFVSSENLIVAKHNLLLPTAIFIITSLLIIINLFIKQRTFQAFLLIAIFSLTIFDLLRFSEKFTPFVERKYLFPDTKSISFLKKNLGNYRIMTTDSSLLPPNFSIYYRLQSVDGYDPLYLKNYGELVAASERKKPNILPPFGFNRIITPKNFESKIIDLLGVKYVLSFSELTSQKLNKVFQEGKTIIYENKNVYPRAFFVESVETAKNKQEAIEKMFEKDKNLRKEAILYDEINIKNFPLTSEETAEIIKYSENKIIINTKVKHDRFLILTDNFYPTWNASIDGQSTKIYQTDYSLRGIIVPKGSHAIIFSVKLF